ncbi:MAG: TAXI family TRAP transporter solute-binding subunit [Ferrovibrio sp.]|uniref:TAXI family TRAP transporter solute-binding subunit n=1 Tax=Ferrovibrio sp. TaxID=1917215 RepID=UPI00260BBFF9|nr:TAXI family TRAP transporter solute-binding subunit [Ferrovibrio sp.]MCW0234563.1 TAXI family TRAP transporter solute-binding subunit [Ferrovibrio sp.]
MKTDSPAGLAALTLGIVLGISTQALASDRIAFGSTAIESVHYTYAVAAAKAINDSAGDKMNVTVIATGGAVDNLARLARGQIQLGLGTFETVYQAYRGIDKFEGKAQPKLRSLWVHSLAIQSYIVRGDSGVKTIADLNGKKFTAGQRGSATENMVQQILAAVDVKPDYYVATLSDAVEAVRNNRSIGYVKAGSGLGLDGTTLELKSLIPINVLSFTPTQVKMVQDRFPFVTFITTKPGDIESLGAITMPIQSIGEFAYSDTITDDQAETILDGVFKGQAAQGAAFPEIKTMDIAASTMTGTLVPLHRGAVRFYQKRGIKIPDGLIPPEAK